MHLNDNTAEWNEKASEATTQRIHGGFWKLIASKEFLAEIILYFEVLYQMIWCHWEIIPLIKLVQKKVYFFISILRVISKL